jgi:hypothetical protein
VTIDPLTEILTIISNMTPGAAPQWNPGMAKMYQIGLRSVPDEGAGILAEAIVDTCTFRPSVHEILTLWRKISAPEAAVSPDTLVAQIYSLRDKYGEFAVSSPDFPGLRLAGEPQWSDPLKRRIVAAMGGWVTFCRDDAPASVQRGQLLKIAQMVVGGEGDEPINRLRLEYQEARAAMPAPALELPEPAREPLAEDEPETGMTRIGAMGLKGLK